MKIKILIPVYNDFQSLSKVIQEINSIISSLDEEFSIIIVNDASTDKTEIDVSSIDKIHSIKILNIKKNQGHARCIATGLKYIFENEEFNYVIPMDGDGEDRPEEIKNFVESIKLNKDKLIVGKRVKRLESLFFKVCYNIHKLITYTFTGKSIKFGNFTSLPSATVEKVINEKATWSSFSGALSKVEKDKVEIPSIRGKRYFGPSKMSFLNLVKHSLAIISVFRFNVLVRSILFLIVYIFSISKNISNITMIPFYVIILLNILTFYFSKRENINKLNSSLENIEGVDQIK